MGQKVHPIGMRVGIIRDWDAKWYAEKEYADYLHEDLAIRKFIQKELADASVSTIEIERAVNKVIVSLHTAKPGMVIGKGGSNVDALRAQLNKLTGKQVHINIVEIKKPDLDAHLVGETIARQLEQRVAFRRAQKQAIQRAMRAGAKGIKTQVSGRLNGADIARAEGYSEGTVPLHTLRADIDYAWEEAEHAAKFAELLGDCGGDTKTNLQKRKDAEQGACEDKKRIATRAKALNLDAIHDTVHEMCKDEARHGKGFEGLYNRYFGDK